MQFLDLSGLDLVQSIKGMDIQTEERFLCEFALGALMEVIKPNFIHANFSSASQLSFLRCIPGRILFFVS